ncbi:MAG: hypothetical protein ACYDGR_15760 [Candidatus Dormibacteria bacterium]
MDPLMRRHQTLVSIVAAVVAPAALVLSLFWGHLDGISSSGALTMFLVAAFLFLILRLVILPVRFGAPNTRARRFGGAALGLLLLLVLLLLTGQGTGALVGIGITVVIFVAVELVARWE